MGLSAEAQEQIREAAVTELKGADMATMTERKLRTAVEGRLGLQLGGDDEKMFLRSVIEKFLDQEDEPADEDDEEEEEIIVKRRKKSGKEAETGGGAGPSSEAKQAKEGGNKKAGKAAAKRQTIGDGNLLVCELGGKKKVTVAKWKNQPLVSIREYYEKDGEQLPGKKGIALTLDQWHTLRDNMSEVEEALTEL